MAFIAPGLAVEAGLRATELHILDGGGRPQLILELAPETKEALVAALVTTDPVKTITVQEVEVVEDPEELDKALQELLEEVEKDPIDSVLVDEEPFPGEPADNPKSTDWASKTKAEIVSTVEDRFGVELDIHDRKDDLIHKAVDLELG